MTPENFTYWLQGFCEMNPNQVPTEEQREMIKSHLSLVFTKVTPELKKDEDFDKLVKDWNNLLEKNKKGEDYKHPDPVIPWDYPYNPYNPTIIC